MATIRSGQIPDIYISRIHSPDDPDCDVHCESFSRLAEIFGRNTPAHRHSRHYQVHLLTQGGIRLYLDDQVYSGEAPLVFMTPPAVPHAFYADGDAEGLVVTVRQETVRAWYAGMPGQWPEALMREAALLVLDERGDESRRLGETGRCLQQEFRTAAKGRSAALNALGLYFFVGLSRLLAQRGAAQPPKSERGDDLRIFLGYCDLIEAHFRDHISVADYARQLTVTEARLNDVCRRIAHRASKELVHDRVMAEARRLLRFSATPVSELGYQLGFADPAYFSRFFKQRIGLAPSEFRLRHLP
jgi:AraC family transcriptional regulator, 4-hydroxyphenylacetate 3-monooxygenase operon regulatory protein